MDSQGELIAENKDVYRDRLLKQSRLAFFVRAWERNKKVESNHAFLLILINFQMLAIVVLTIGLYFYVSSELPSDRFFAVNSNKSTRQMGGLYRPNNSRNSLAVWVSDAVVDILTFGFNDYGERFSISKKHFTKKGWEAFVKAAQTTGFVREIEENKQILTVAPRSFPVLLKDGFIDGSFKWVYELEVLITYRSGGKQSNSSKRVRVFVEKISTSESPTGVGISSLIL